MPSFAETWTEPGAGVGARVAVGSVVGVLVGRAVGVAAGMTVSKAVGAAVEATSAMVVGCPAVGAQPETMTQPNNNMVRKRGFWFISSSFRLGLFFG
jgi:hypothetical protein